MVTDCSQLSECALAEQLADQRRIIVETIIAQAAKLLAERLEGRYVAILLVGSAARSEATFSVDGTLLSDLDFVVVLPQRHVLTASLEEYRCRKRIQPLYSRFKQIAAGGISVGFANAVPRYWSIATPLLWELRTNARVLYGTSDVRDWPAIQSAEQIPQWEGIRLVANRMCELLDVVGKKISPALANQTLNDERSLRYACTKMVLACSEAHLIDVHEYRASYRERQRQHQQRTMHLHTEQYELIEAAYRTKVEGQEYGLQQDTVQLISRTLQLAVATLAHFGLRDPAALAKRVRAERPAAPGSATQLSFFVLQRVQGKNVAAYRAIAEVYEQAFALALEIANAPHYALAEPSLGARCERIASMFRSTPQLVSIVNRGAI